VVAARDAAHHEPAHRAHDALLARPLRHRPAEGPLRPAHVPQNVLLRREALGNFRTLLHGIARDPAMLVYLDNAGSRRQAPNENFAREVMELFTLGEGRYSVARREGGRARASRLEPGARDRRVRLPARWHDSGEKTVLGRTAASTAPKSSNLLLERPRPRSSIVTKLWLEFVSPTPDAAEVRRIASSSAPRATR
jgi:uncharacterized protein (DUF1800 family)